MGLKTQMNVIDDVFLFNEMEVYGDIFTRTNPIVALVRCLLSKL